MAKDKRSKDQKRKAKLAERARKRAITIVEPYEGRKYQQPQWEPLMLATEEPIYEVILATKRRLKNDEVRKALTQLVLDLRAGTPPTLSEEEPEPILTVGAEAPFLVWNIRGSWTEFFETHHQVAVPDLIGVLRTLLNSIDAQAWATGPERGYVDFLYGYMQRIGIGEMLEFREEFEE